MREYVPHSGQEYGHVVTLQMYVLHNWCAYGPTVTCGGPVPRVTVRVFVMLGIYFVSVKYMFVSIKLMCVYVKLLKI
jgi:hypothetical protein